MRDPMRIKEILHLLDAAWNKVPDWRLAQLVSNMARDHKPWPDIFCFEDDDLKAKLKEFVRE